MAIRDEKDLANAIDNDQDYIEIEGDLAQKVIKIKATGTVAWAIAIAAIAVAVTTALTTAGTGGVATPVTAPLGVVSSGAAVAALGGTSVMACAVSIAVAAGGVGVLNKLRGYTLIEKGNKVILKK